jgi:hypothetical protein
MAILIALNPFAGNRGDSIILKLATPFFGILKGLESYPWFWMGYASWNIFFLIFLVVSLTWCIITAVKISMGHNRGSRPFDIIMTSKFILPDVLIYIVITVLEHYDEMGFMLMLLTSVSLSFWCSIAVFPYYNNDLNRAHVSTTYHAAIQKHA